MVHGKNRIPYWIDRRLTGLAGPDYDATISFGLPFEPEDSQYGEYRMKNIALPPLPPSHQHAWGTSALTDGPFFPALSLGVLLVADLKRV